MYLINIISQLSSISTTPVAMWLRTLKNMRIQILSYQNYNAEKRIIF
jgi:hypothetical protein